MITVLDALRGVNAYPIPLSELVRAAELGGLDAQSEATADITSSAGFKRSKAELLLWLALAPDISQGGQSYSFTDEQRLQLRHQARALLAECGDGEALPKAVYGYKGSRL